MHLFLADLDAMADPKISGLPLPDPARIEQSGRWLVRPPLPNRHGAISRKLFNYSNYKSWAEEMKHAWDDDKDASADDDSTKG